MDFFQVSPTEVCVALSKINKIRRRSLQIIFRHSRDRPGMSNKNKPGTKWNEVTSKGKVLVLKGRVCRILKLLCFVSECLRIQTSALTARDNSKKSCWRAALLESILSARFFHWVDHRVSWIRRLFANVSNWTIECCRPNRDTILLYAYLINQTLHPPLLAFNQLVRGKILLPHCSVVFQ